MAFNWFNQLNRWNFYLSIDLNKSTPLRDRKLLRMGEKNIVKNKSAKNIDDNNALTMTV